LVLLLAILAVSGCGQTETATQGFQIGTYQCIGTAGIPPSGGMPGIMAQCTSPPIPIPYVPVAGSWDYDDVGAEESVEYFGDFDSNSTIYDATTDGTGTVTAGGAYTPLASKMVSSVGSYFNQNVKAMTQSFTSTLASASTINPNQVGAPPLVVQDGWAVVTATPTGFTISDITGQVVLVSERTPSPVTAIAVDSKLNVAYLVMPDSNTLLTVPLPGTN
jgi:hypothetical protein